MTSSSFNTAMLWSSIQIEQETIDSARNAILQNAKGVADAKYLFDMLGLKDADLHEMS